MRRKPGEPIYLKHHMLGLALAVVSPILLPFLYHRYVEPLSFDTLFFAGMIIALIGSLALYFAYRSSAQNEP
jgi:Na+/melibiose symporter-like transporter